MVRDPVERRILKIDTIIIEMESKKREKGVYDIMVNARVRKCKLYEFFQLIHIYRNWQIKVFIMKCMNSCFHFKKGTST